MRTSVILSLLLLIMTLNSCSDDDEIEMVIDLTGIYALTTARDECSDATNNGSTTAGDDGVCITTSAAVTCYEMTLTLNNDNTFTFEQIVRTTVGGISSSERATEAGTYSVDGDILTTNDLNTFVTDYAIAN